MKIFLLLALLLMLSACTAPPQISSSAYHVRGDILYLPDTTPGRQNAEKLKSIYRFKQAIIFRDLDQRRVRHLEAVRQVAPDYPAALCEEHVEGTVTVVFIVDEHGKVVEAAIVASTNPLFERPALRAIMQWTFSPATYDGAPFRSVVNMPIEFALK
jgi:TonB family protein